MKKRRPEKTNRSDEPPSRYNNVVKKKITTHKKMYLYRVLHK